MLKNLPANAGDTRDKGLIPGFGSSAEIGNGKEFPNSCLENSTDKEPNKLVSMGLQRVRHAEHTCTVGNGRYINWKLM